MKNAIIIILIIVIILGVGFYFWNNKKTTKAPEPMPSKQTEVKEKTYGTFPGILPVDQITNKKTRIQLVTKGYFEIELYSDTPKATSNFIQLAKDNFYNEKVFYKVTPGVKADGGSKFVDGKDGVSYQFEDELTSRTPQKGSVAMVSGGPNTNGSRFFIVLGDNNQLENKYTIFGKVLSGQDVIDRIQEGDMIENIIIENL